MTGLLLRHSFIRFGLIGGVATLIHALIFLITLRLDNSQLTGNVAGYALASIWSYILNARWTFAMQLSWRGFLKFQVANSIVLIWSVTVAWIGETMHFKPLWTLLFTVLVGPVLNYLGHKYFTFRNANYRFK